MFSGVNQRLDLFDHQFELSAPVFSLVFFSVYIINGIRFRKFICVSVLYFARLIDIFSVEFQLRLFGSQFVMFKLE